MSTALMDHLHVPQPMAQVVYRIAGIFVGLDLCGSALICITENIRWLYCCKFRPLTYEYAIQINMGFNFHMWRMTAKLKKYRLYGIQYLPIQDLH